MVMHRHQRRFHSFLLSLSWKLLLLFTVVAWESVAKTAIKQDKQDGFVVAGYLPNYRFDDYNTTAALPFLTDLILFSIEPNKYGIVTGTCCLDGTHYTRAKEAIDNLQKQQPKTRLWVSVGGAGRSQAFPIIASDPEKRTQFLSNLLTLCLMNGLSGVDFNWEQPTTRQEYQSYMVLLMEACRLFHPSKLLVSTSTRQPYLPRDMVEELDLVFVETYQLGSYYHADFDAVTTYMQQQWFDKYPHDKLVLGIPAYGQKMTTANGGPPDKTYQELVEDAMKTAKKKRNRASWDALDSHLGYKFESPKDVRQKVMYAKQHGLGGICFWELGQDLQLLPDTNTGCGGMLLEAAATAAAQDTVKKKNPHNEEL